MKRTIAYIDGYNLYYGLLKGTKFKWKDFKKNVIVLNPHVRRSDLERYASYYKDIPRDLPSCCQLPDIVPLPNGYSIHRPEAW